MRLPFRSLARRFDEVRSVPAWVILLLVGTVAVSGWFMNFVLFSGGLLLPVHRATGGLVNGTLQANLIILVVEVGLVLLVIGRLRCRDLALRPGDLPAALGWTAGTWAVIQRVGVITACLGAGHLAWHEAWRVLGASRVIGELMGQLFGNALSEEIIFRGFLIAQIHLWLARRRGLGPGRAMVLSVLISQGLFALSHLPNRLSGGVEGTILESGWLADQGMLFFMGLVLAAVYLRTGNLFIAVGLHALMNAPTLLVSVGQDVIAPMTVFVIMLFMILVPARRPGSADDT